MRLTRDASLGILAVLLAGAYLAEATQIQQSLLADAVGADGVPRMLAYGMGGVGIGLILREAIRPAEPATDHPPLRAHLRAHLRALGLLAILTAYLLAVPWLGYGVTIAALVSGSALYAGAKPGRALIVTGVAGAIFFWVMFKLLLGIQMPAGVFLWG